MRARSEGPEEPARGRVASSAGNGNINMSDLGECRGEKGKQEWKNAMQQCSNQERRWALKGASDGRKMCSAVCRAKDTSTSAPRKP